MERSVTTGDCERITAVIHFLAHHKHEAITGLFPECTESYYDTWSQRDILHFWGHLDIGGQRKLIGLALQFYSSVNA